MERPVAAASEALTPAQLASVDAVIERWRTRPGALIPVLEEVQGVVGYLPEAIQRRVADGLALPLSQVYGVVTFYSYFTMTPRGRHPIRICLGTACHVRGAQRNLEAIQGALRIAPGECTADREFSLEAVRCLGACGLAPVLVVDEDVHKQVKSARVGELLARYAPQEREQGDGDA